MKFRARSFIVPCNQIGDNNHDDLISDLHILAVTSSLSYTQNLKKPLHIPAISISKILLFRDLQRIVHVAGYDLILLQFAIKHWHLHQACLLSEKSEKSAGPGHLSKQRKFLSRPYDCLEYVVSSSLYFFPLWLYY